MDMKEFIRAKALAAGFSAVGFTTAEPLEGKGRLEEAVRDGRTGCMGWLAREPAARCDPRSLMQGARSVICLALAYGGNGLAADPSNFSGEGGPRVSHEDDLKIARFARGADYHGVIRKKAKGLWRSIQERAPDSMGRICVDTSPILEKALAERSGIGWIGKHTVLVNEELGSWFVLGEIITDLELEPDAPAACRCGECTKCIDACPVRALLSPYVLDSRLCISCLTIEERGRCEDPAHRDDSICGWGYGCDECLEACPYNDVTRNR